MKGRNRAVLFVLFHILSFQAVAGIPDICESCKRVEECSQVGEMSREQQEKWIQEHSCKAPEDLDATTSPDGFSAVAKGDYVCCPAHEVWDIKADNPSVNNEDDGANTTPHKAVAPQNFWFQSQPRTVNDFFNFNQQNFLNNQQNNFNPGLSQCPPQSSPPSPESGCCGADESDGDRITDLEEFLQLNSLYSDYGSQYNSPLYSMYQRAKREAEIDDLGITFEDRIAGGRETDLDQYPWTAYLSIQFLNGDQIQYFGCGGSLISSRFILTAAHCLVHENAKLMDVEVTLAEYDKRTFPSDCITVRGRKPVCIENLKVSVENVIIHSNFIEQYLINDIALLKLREAVPYTRNIRPICLPPINIDSPEFSNLPLATAGWGLNVSVESDVKQFTIIHMVPKGECSAHYTTLTDGHLCASGKRTEDTCKGDSGGPLMMVYRGKYYLVGIVSGKTAAFSCGTPVPSLYTHVYTYLDWINYFVN